MSGTLEIYLTYTRTEKYYVEDEDTGAGLSRSSPEEDTSNPLSWLLYP